MPGLMPSPTTSRIDHAPAWIDAPRRHGREALSLSRMPEHSAEDWKYVELDFVLEEFQPAGAPSSGLGRDEYLEMMDNPSGQMSMIDGTVVATEGDEAEVAGVADLRPEVIVPRYRTLVSPELDIFSAANHAFSPPGGAVVLPAGRAVRSPVVIDVQAVASETASYPHLTIIGEAGSEGRVVVVYRSAPGARLLAAPVMEVFAGDGAHLAVTVVQHMGGNARLVAHHHYTAGRDATVRIDEIGLGGRYARQRLEISLAGQGSSTRMGGIYFGDQRQVLDYRIYVNHQGPRTSSDIFLKGAVAGRAEAVWTGLMRIENSAAGTSAFETNRNLVLSDRAKVHSVPNLEILTDDLQCGHGSSSGPLDEEQLYYLMSRGLPKDTAERLLMRGFFDEILSKLSVSRLADPSRTAVAAKFAAAQRRRAGS